MLRVAAADRAGLLAHWARAGAPEPAVRARVAEILADVARRGDAALLEWTARLDGVRLASAAALRVESREIRAACRRVPAPLLEALRESALRVERFAAATLPRPFTQGAGSGIVTGQRVVPVGSAGFYIPGGKARYPSSVLMNALPARVAGVERRILCTPPGPRGDIAPLVLAAAAECGVDAVYRVGGAQAIAAMAFGTRSLAPVDVITGPGNAYVAEAKRQVMGRVGIDSIAGPSELAVLADHTADAAVVAGRLLAQAEHDEDARVALVTAHAPLLAAVAREVARRLKTAPRRGILRESLGRSLLVPARSHEEARHAIDWLAPEHLEIHTREPEADADRIRTAGAVFIGAGSPTALGDYGAGPNHTLPTGRSARFASALSAAHFVRMMTTLRVEPAGDPEFFAGAARLARAEELPNHAATLAGPAAPRRRAARGREGRAKR